MPPPPFNPPTSSSQDDSTTDSEHEDANVDPELRLRTVRTAASTIAASNREEARVQRRKKRSLRLFRSKSKEKRKARDGFEEGEEDGKRVAANTPRRNVYVNLALASSERNPQGEPLVTYVRNKVKTTKYTIITFLPKNLYEQFRRVANLYFLALVVIQVFPVFGAAGGNISMIPLVFIISVTAIKDGVEDYRRSTLDDEVNNSAATKLGDWLNVNQPTDPRNFFERLLGLNKPGKVSKGVRKLRAREMESVGMPVQPREQINEEYSFEEGEGWEDDRTATGHGEPTPQKGDWPMESSATLAASAHNSKVDLSNGPDYHSSYPPVPVPAIPSYFKNDGSVGSASGGRDRSGSIGGSSTQRSHSGSLSNSGSIRSSTTVVGSSSRPQSANQSSPLRNPMAQASGQQSGDESVIDWSAPSRGTAQWERTLWKKLEVGDVVLLRESEQVPADIIVLSTSEPDGLCYLETKNLDGETNLKPRRALRATRQLKGEEDVERARFVLDSEGPSANLYTYSGVLRYSFSGGKEKAEPVGPNEILLRGTTLRNTAWVIGLVVFTGADTKIMLNSGSTPSKRSKIERETNFNVVMNFIVLILMCVGSAIGSGVIGNENDTSTDFFEKGSEPSSSEAVNAIVTFASCLIAFQNIVPISLYISIEIVKTIQAYFIAQDIGMYYEPLNAACTPKTWNISDDLGQIEYIFSDKTGTLTQNVMELQRVSVGGVPYGEGVTEAMKGKAKQQADENGSIGEDDDEQEERIKKAKREMVNILQGAFRNRWAQPDQLTLVSPQLARDLADPSSSQHEPLVCFFRALAVCHSVLPDRPPPAPNAMPDAAKKSFVVNYKAESPDEAALVAGARDVGFPFVSTSSTSVQIEVLGRPERFTPLRTLEFTSARKRMSVLVRDTSGRIILYSKGADSVIYQRLRKLPDHVANDTEEDRRERDVRDKTARDMEDFANGGLRTLCVAHRILTPQEYESWSETYDVASTSLTDREAKVDAAMDALEVDLNVLGATALEDKLQEGVPAAIEMLHKAGIKLWILTGDKVQTAIEIGYSCNLLKSGMDVMVLAATSKQEARAKIQEGLSKVVKATGHGIAEKAAPLGGDGGFAVVIDGETLRYALEEDLKSLFLNLATRCETVVCCRVSPSQKALTVKLVKEGRNALTLSIGDGANDVAMIQEANVGCGLLGHEGSQAAMSADYAFGQFRFLTKLLIVHGRWSYLRVANMHKNFFYKNVIWTFAMFWYLFYNSFDGTYLYQYSFILLYNVVFTSLPVISLGAFDQDINARAALAFPQLYARGILGKDYTRTKFWLYMGDGLYQSVVVFFIPFFVWGGGGVGGVGGGGGGTVEGGGVGGGTISWNGKGIDSLADFGTTIAVAAIITANLYVGINTYYWTAVTWVVVIGSSLVMIIWIPIYSLFETMDFNLEVVVLYGNVTFWATVILTVAVAIGPRFIVRFARASYFPLDRDVVREMWVLGDLKRDLGIAPRKNRDRKGSTSAKESAEMAPISRYHDRSISEATVNIGFPEDMEQGGYGYEQAYSKSPGDFPVRLPQTIGAGYIDSPPESSGTSTAVDSRGSGQGPEHELGWKWKTDSAMSLQYVVDGEPEPLTQYALSPGAHRSPPTRQSPLPVNPSPSPSYYSANDIPAPSPLPDAQYVTLDGQVTAWNPAQRSAQSRTRESPDHTPTTTPTSTSFLQAPAPPHHHPSFNPADQDSNAIEMRVRGAPPSSFPRGLRANTSNTNPYLRSNSSNSTLGLTRTQSNDTVSAAQQGRATSRASTVSRYATASEGEGEGEETDMEEQVYDQEGYYLQHRPGSMQSLTPRAL